jgi:hypothetical protein
LIISHIGNCNSETQRSCKHSAAKIHTHSVKNPKCLG